MGLADWKLLAERATLLSDDIREQLGADRSGREFKPAQVLSPDAEMYAGAVATLLGTFARHIDIEHIDIEIRERMRR